MGRWWTLLAIAALLVGAATAEAEAGNARDIFEQAVAADDNGDVRTAIELYRSAIEADPSARFAARALARVRALEPLANDRTLEELADILREYERIGSRDATDRAEGLLESAGTVEAEIAIRDWLGNEYAAVQNDEDRAIAHFHAIARMNSAPPGAVETALVSAARAARTNEERRLVAAAIDEAVDRRDDLDPAGVATARDENEEALRRAFLRPAAGASLVLLGLVAALRRRQPRSTTKRDLAVLAYVFGVGAVLAEQWEHGYALSFACALPAVAVVHLMGRLGRPDDDASRLDRAATGSLIAAATFAAVFLTFDALGNASVFGL